MGTAVRNLLAIETSGGSCSVALSRGGEIYLETEEAPREHARKLLPMVDRLLRVAGIAPADLDAIAYTSGPGSFTGLRIGFGVVQGLAFGCDIPVIGVSTLQCMACKMGRSIPASSGLVVPALDARMGEIYLGAYRLGAGLPDPVVEDCAVTPGSVHTLLPPAIDFAVGEGWSLVDRESLAIEFLDDKLVADAETLLAMAGILYDEQRYVDIDRAGLSYVRNEVSWKKREKIRSS